MSGRVLTRYALLLTAALLVTTLAAQTPAAVDASVDRSELALGETLLLTLDLRGELNLTAPQLEPLQRDFKLISRSSNSQLSLIDGRPSSTTQWLIELEPRRQGRLTVPALRVGELNTPPIDIQVAERPAGDADEPPPLFIEIELEPKTPYVGEQMFYLQRLFYPPTLRDGSLDNELPATLRRQQLGDDVYFVGERDGRRYRVLERRFALFADASGELTLPAVTFSGRLAQTGQQLGLRRGRRVSARGEPITIEVRPRPSQFEARHWLPSAELALHQRWSQNPPQFTVGEPITRTLILQAKGLRAEQLPPLPLSAPDGMTYYPDQTLRESRFDERWLIASSRQSVAMVPTRAGELELPEIRLDWWDTTADRPRSAVLPAQRVTVLPAAAAAAAPLAAPTPAPAAAAAPPPRWYDAPFWPLAAAALLALWLLTLSGWLRERRRASPSRPRRDDGAARSDRATVADRRQLREACAANDPAAASQALLTLAARRLRPAPRTLGELAARLHRDADVDAVLTLHRARYAPATASAPNSDSGWDGAELWRRLGRRMIERRAAPASAAGADDDSGLPPLYPPRTDC